jgi:hypothetical protein
MAEKETTSINADFIVDAKKDAELLKYAEQVFKTPGLLSQANIAELSPENPALASKVLLSAYTRALLAEARTIDPKKEKEVFSTLYSNYANVVQEFLDKNKQLLNELSSKKQKGGE